MEKTIFHFVEKYQTFSVGGRKTMLVNMDHVAYVEVIESCE